MKFLKKAAATTALFLASAVAAAAFPAVATSNTAVHSGPGSGYPLIDRLYPGERVNVVDRDGGWYLLSGDGWVRTSSLDAIGESYYYEPRPHYYVPPHHRRNHPDFKFRSPAKKKD